MLVRAARLLQKRAARPVSWEALFESELTTPRSPDRFDFRFFPVTSGFSDARVAQLAAAELTYAASWL
jgi:hypothetical protein